MKLDKYNSKRNFNKTKEPIGKLSKDNKCRFSCQHHLARRDHYDLRLEMNGVLVSYAIPKGPSYNPKDKRLIIKTEDHPISYLDFEGTIPKGEYGGGTVMLFDIGTFKLIEKTKDYIKFILYGTRLKGKWIIIKNNLLIKENDYYSNFIDINKYKRSVKSNRTFKEIELNKKITIDLTSKDKKIINNITKNDIYNYYKLVSNKMLPYIENRSISVVRKPNNEKFFKKHFNNIYLNKYKDKYYILDTIGILSEVQMNSYEFHISINNIHKLPNLMVFDFDPDKNINLNTLRDGVKKLKEILDKLNLKSYLKTSGNKGYHVVVPVKNMSFKKIKKLSLSISLYLVKLYPDMFTINIRKKNRINKIFIDYLRNNENASFIAPYSFKLNGKVSLPIKWSELDTIKPDDITIDIALKRLKKKDPWESFFT